MKRDEVGTLARLRAPRREPTNPKLAQQGLGGEILNLDELFPIHQPPERGAFLGPQWTHAA